MTCGNKAQNKCYRKRSSDPEEVLLESSRENQLSFCRAMQMPCKCCANAVQMLCKCCANAVQMLCKCCANAVQMLCKCCANAVQMLCKCCANAFRSRDSSRSQHLFTAHDVSTSSHNCSCFEFSHLCIAWAWSQDSPRLTKTAKRLPQLLHRVTKEWVELGACMALHTSLALHAVGCNPNIKHSQSITKSPSLLCRDYWLKKHQTTLPDIAWSCHILSLYLPPSSLQHRDLSARRRRWESATLSTDCESETFGLCG